MKLVRIDKSMLGDHGALEADDNCYFFGEYFPRKGYQGSELNQLVFNLKKPTNHAGRPGFHYKSMAITKCANELTNLIERSKQKEVYQNAWWMPIPPSKAKHDPLYDDRLIQVLEQVSPSLRIMDAFKLLESMRAHHEHSEGESRPSREHLEARISLARSCLAVHPLPSDIFVFDDVITTGTHFKVCQTLLRQEFGKSCPRVRGIFIARVKRPEVLDGFEFVD